MKQHVHTVGIDLAKKNFHLVGTDTTGKIVWRKRLTRHALMPFMAQLPPVTIGLEACGGAHYWARQLRHHGHQVKLMAPQFVKPYVKSNKNDMRDAEAIAEAVMRPTMRFVPIRLFLPNPRKCKISLPALLAPPGAPCSNTLDRCSEPPAHRGPLLTLWG